MTIDLVVVVSEEQWLSAFLILTIAFFAFMFAVAVGAALISVMGWWYMKHDRESFIDTWIQKFIDKNPDRFES